LLPFIGKFHRMRAGRSTQVKNGGSDASMQGFIVWPSLQMVVHKAVSFPRVEVCSWDLRTIVQHENQHANHVALGGASPELLVIPEKPQLWLHSIQPCIPKSSELLVFRYLYPSWHNGKNHPARASEANM
jgi:hypothetical protein